jgi:hypothetical protein
MEAIVVVLAMTPASFKHHSIVLIFTCGLMYGTSGLSQQQQHMKLRIVPHNAPPTCPHTFAAHFTCPHKDGLVGEDDIRSPTAAGF